MNVAACPLCLTACSKPFWKNIDGPKFNIQMIRMARIFLIGTIILLLWNACVIPEGILIWKDYSISNKAEQFHIDNSFLRKYLPEIKNPRMMTRNDLRNTDNIEDLRIGRWSFIIHGDFNKDGYPDVAVVGKCDYEYPGKFIFIAIFTNIEGIISNQFLDWAPEDRALLQLEKGTMIVEGIDEKYDVIMLAVNLGSEYEYVIVWDGNKYIISTEAYYKQQYEGP